MSSPAFVGRERELAEFTRALAAPPALVLAEGEAGIGKSRLVREYLSRPPGQGRRVLVACCPPLGRPQTLAPVADAFRQAAREVGGLRLSAVAGALRPLFPEWAALPAGLDPAEDATASRHRVFTALAELACCLEVAVLVVEDAHWADEATLEFLLYLASRQPQPLSLVVTYRPEDVPAGSLLPRLSSRLSPGTTRLRVALGPLDVAGTAEFVSSMLAGEHVSAGFAAFLHEHTEGLPLTVEESVRLMVDRGDVFQRDGGWVRRHLADITVPATIRDAVQERAGRLSADAQAVLQAAAVLADPVDEAALRALPGLAAERFRAGLCEALGSGLLTEDDRGRVSFRHVLACRAVYEAIPVPERRALHLRAGRVLEALSPLPAAQLARHFREAGETNEWCRYAEQAADLALASGDEATACVLLHDLVTGAGLPTASLARLTGKIPLVSFTGRARYRDIVGALRSVVDAGNLGPGEEADVRFQLGQVLNAMDAYEAARAELERAIPHLAHDPSKALRAMMGLAWPRGSTCPASRHLRWVRRAAELTGPSMTAADQLRFAVDRASVLLMLGQQAGWAEATQIPDDASTVKERLQITRGNLNIGDHAMRWGLYAEAKRRLARALELARSHQCPRLYDEILVTQVHLDWFTGGWDGLAEGTAVLADNDDLAPVARLEAVLVSGLLHAATGAHAHAEERLWAVLTETRQRDMAYAAESAAGLARLWLADGRAGDALEVTETPIDIVAAKGIWVWATDLAPARVAALAAAGRAGEASELVSSFARGLRGRNAPAPRAGLIICRAILAEAQGEPARAATLFARAAGAWQALPRPYDALLAREQQARCLVAIGSQDAGLVLLGDVLRGMAQLGATGAAARVARTLRENGLQVRRPGAGRPSYGDQLSPRELEVVCLLVTGQANREIAEQLFLSPKTVARHLGSAMRKLNVSSRTALAARVVQAGLIPAAPGESLAGSRDPAAGLRPVSVFPGLAA
jgi:DNA-binding CsgD family transcriptional regulator/tetratricopeptide (TPR) repeat protein